MKKDFIEKQKQKLIELKNELLATINGHNEQVSDIAGVSEPGDEADIASQRIEGTLMNELGEQSTRRLNMINAALDRIEQNQYGICLLCEKPIPESRLEVLPYAPLCVDCQARQERRDR
ncbi:MAG TPA: conjugal transfer protein TraR [Treponema sp.]|jgi:RNA polymerase-binding protein DksA|nr:TraR/DksA family transcriptional regulator [Treponema sp.]HAK69020.1 conjugal transfer protein TraR [Treponema sp.]HBB42536.1 conjugal transfer protein TraR [Treponema sp.]HCA19807.1 conjugal transfer protein TraR [Treponema sp.]